MPHQHPPKPADASDRYVHEEQHGPEMDDTQAQATGELADRFEPVDPDLTSDEQATS